MEVDHSITVFIRELQEGNRDNADRVWKHFYRRLLPLARKCLHDRVRRVIDEEDVVLRAIEECFQQLEAGYIPSIRDRDNLWALLATITERRALNANRDMLCEKRGGGNVRGNSFFANSNSSIGNGFEQLQDREPSPELGAMMAEALSSRMIVLDQDLQEVAIRKLQGFSNREIAAALDCAVVTVERRLNRIRKKWSAVDDNELPGAE